MVAHDLGVVKTPYVVIALIVLGVLADVCRLQNARYAEARRRRSS